MFSRHAENRFLVLFLSLLCLIWLSPLFGSTARIAIVLDLFYSFLLVSCIFAVSANRRNAVIASLLGLPFLAVTWGGHYYLFGMGVYVLAASSGIIFIGSIIYMIFRSIISQKSVSLEVIYGAIVIYLLVGVFFALCFGIMYLFDPGSFHFGSDLIADSRLRFLYFSYVTITTLGYGDISPVAPIARSTAMLEAMVGQIYLVVLVAWLVGMHVSQSIAESSGKNQ